MSAVDFERRLEGGNLGDGVVWCFSQFFIKPLMYDWCRTILAPYIIDIGGVGMVNVFQLVIIQPLYNVGKG